MIVRTWTIRCDDDTEHGDCPSVSDVDILGARFAAEQDNWSSNGRTGNEERWHCPDSDKPWCAEGCGNPAVSRTYCGPCLEAITNG